MNKTYKILYTLSTLIIFLSIYFAITITFYSTTNFIDIALFIIDIIFITFTLIVMLKNKNYKAKKIDLAFIISYYIFSIIVIASSILLNYNSDILNYMLSLMYYYRLLLIGNILLTTYTLLIFKSSKK